MSVDVASEEIGDAIEARSIESEYKTRRKWMHVGDGEESGTRHRPDSCLIS